jgi:hypothetical protein
MIEQQYITTYIYHNTAKLCLTALCILESECFKHSSEGDQYLYQHVRLVFI